MLRVRLCSESCRFLSELKISVLNLHPLIAVLGSASSITSRFLGLVTAPWPCEISCREYECYLRRSLGGRERWRRWLQAALEAGAPHVNLCSASISSVSEWGC
jgi:hypothetical protein